ncbi:hypothetical protein Pmar_PMAR000528 [Perkinsus marinus ATCC 50983]|uniref:Uncharacterized protein n=1 Tax=Perkinsus marinus (strain ATCC 50983 / TXsc) TaxID=423536 RepID=C5LIV6_PERM5|nr:hypothetical protein Pmar_PMAR000528 [Perkinsus marinus ATCC 50983]EER03291.1 hypothetical protein Pmar_PMAR000528 [Perkinsus marinus ATCC 50983]|eukprot:XP_002771475.1 hypothetical protein Pmar_PMAR000528 [Perkinsus marinus ATCC 50983]
MATNPNIPLYLFTLVLAVLQSPASGLTTRRQLVRKTYCTTLRRSLGIGTTTPCGFSDQAETEGLVLPGMDDGVLTEREDIILTDDGMARVEALPNRPYKYVLTANSADYSRYEEIFGGVAMVISEGAVDGNTDYEAQGHAYRHFTDLVKSGFTSLGRADLDGTPAQVFVGYAANIPGGHVLDELAKEGLSADFFTMYMDENVDGKLLKMEARNSYMGNELYQEVLVTAYGELKDDMSLEEAVDELHATYASTVKYNMSLQNPFRSSAFHTHSPAMVSSQYLPETERLSYSAYDERWTVLDWVKNGRGTRSLRKSNASSIFQPIEYFGIEPNSAAEEYFKNQRHGRKLVDVAFPKACSLTEKPVNESFCIHAAINRDGSKNNIDVIGSVFDYLSPNTTRISAGLNVVQERNLAVDMHISGGGTISVYSVGDNVRLDATATYQILDGGNPRYFDGEVKIACGYQLTGEVSIKVASFDVISAPFGGTGVTGGGANNLIGNYIPLSGGVDYGVSGFKVKGTMFGSSQGGSFLKYKLEFPLVWGFWFSAYMETGVLLIFNHTEFNLISF